MQSPILASPNFDQNFYIYSFSSEHTIETVLTHRDASGEHPIAFMRTNLKEDEKKYSKLDKKDYALVKVVKKL